MSWFGRWMTGHFCVVKAAESSRGIRMVSMVKKTEYALARHRTLGQSPCGNVQMGFRAENAPPSESASGEADHVDEYEKPGN